MSDRIENLHPRLQTPISTTELTRRWSAVRAAMEAEKIDVLVMQNNNDHMGGAVKWFTDIPATNGYPITVIFPRDDEMTVVMHGAFDWEGRPPETVWRGVKQMLTTPSFASAHYTNDYDPRLAVKALKGYAKGTIGFVHTYQLSFALGSHIREALPEADFKDASELVDRIKVIKSPEEFDLIRRTAAMQDGAMRAAFEAIKPGMRDREVSAVAQFYSQRQGSENGIYLCASMPFGEPAKYGQRHMQNRVIEKGDIVALLVEDSGPGGMYAELGRVCVVDSKVPQSMVDELEFVKQARRFTLDRLTPGKPCGEIWDQYNDFMRENGRPEESRVHCHGQGYDLVERPLVRKDEPWVIAKDMNMAVHPGYIHGGHLNWLCDNYIIGADGPGDRLHQFPEEILAVG